MEESPSSKQSDDTLVFECQAMHSFEAEEENELSFEQGDMLTITRLRSDGWWEATNTSEQTGLVPSTFLKVPDNMKSLVKNAVEVEKERKSDISSGIKNLIKKNLSLPVKEHNTLPKGFRPSKLFEEVNESSYYSLGNFMVPKIDETGLSFEDIHYEKPSGLLKQNPAPLQRKINIIAARHIPEPPKEFRVRSRHIRMCFHDGNRVLSNIHTVKAKWNESSPRLWMFNLKLSSMDSCAEDGEIFIKSDKCVPTLGILFELCISYEDKNEIIQEMCAGWVFMKLLNDSGEPVKSKTVILKVQDSVPFAAYLSHLSSPGKPISSSFELPNVNRGKLGLFKKIIDKQKVSRIVVSISNPDRASVQHISYFPSTLIGPWSCISLIALCRKITADDLLNQSAYDSTERVSSPLLASLPVMLNEADLLDALRVSWALKLKTFDTDDLRTDQMKKKAFQDLFLRTIYVLLNSNGLPPYVFGDSATEKTRKSEIDRILNLPNSQESCLALSDEIEFSPISINKLSTRMFFNSS
ncbi:hypothetical protein JTE90_010788 [Oedothorax gibbosus]|uniref:SH3 domain-containing protein n=1 Tax=Oedothorax gibbosus TaxID=931172 RepID=A0AAV6VFI3_9ARAC|nr:hypothetical protein JTE90_010788 [Oedothorax gibbosus]